MSVQSEISRLSTAKTRLSSWLSSNGVTVQNGSKLDALVTLLQNLKIQRYYTGTTTPSSSLGSNGDLYFME